VKRYSQDGSIVFSQQLIEEAAKQLHFHEAWIFVECALVGEA